MLMRLTINTIDHQNAEAGHMMRLPSLSSIINRFRCNKNLFTTALLSLAWTIFVAIIVSQQHSIDTFMEIRLGSANRFAGAGGLVGSEC
jgi:hypothetical protein